MRQRFSELSGPIYAKFGEIGL